MAVKGAAAETKRSLCRSHHCCCTVVRRCISHICNLKRHHDPWDQLLHTDTELGSSLNWGLGIHESPSQPKMPGNHIITNKQTINLREIIIKRRERTEERWEISETSSWGGRIWQGGRWRGRNRGELGSDWWRIRRWLGFSPCFLVVLGEQQMKATMMRRRGTRGRNWKSRNWRCTTSAAPARGGSSSAINPHPSLSAYRDNTVALNYFIDFVF